MTLCRAIKHENIKEINKILLIGRLESLVIVEIKN